eukprot:g448.t1
MASKKDLSILPKIIRIGLPVALHQESFSKNVLLGNSGDNDKQLAAFMHYRDIEAGTNYATFWGEKGDDDYWDEDDYWVISEETRRLQREKKKRKNFHPILHNIAPNLSSSKTVTQSTSTNEKEISTHVRTLKGTKLNASNIDFTPLRYTELTSRTTLVSDTAVEEIHRLAAIASYDIKTESKTHIAKQTNSPLH